MKRADINTQSPEVVRSWYPQSNNLHKASIEEKRLEYIHSTDKIRQVQ